MAITGDVTYRTGTISLGIDDAEMAEVRDTLKGIQDGAEIAIRSAINDTLKFARTEVVRRLREHLNLTASDVRQQVYISRQATGAELSGAVSITYNPVPLEEFKAWFRRKTGVRVTTVKDMGKKTFRHMFRATMASGHTGIFERVKGAPKVIPKSGRYAGKVIGGRQRVEGSRQRNRRTARRVLREVGSAILRQPIKETFGPSVMVAFDRAPTLADDALQAIGNKFTERLASKVQWQLEKGTPAPESTA